MKAARFPILSTVVVATVAVLLARLGFWQIDRLHEKEALLAHYATNLDRPPVAFVALWPAGEDSLYRRTNANCAAVTGWQAGSGRDRAGNPGYRHVALCRAGIAGPGFAADVGISRSPKSPAWQGGPVRGRLITMPSSDLLIMRLFRPAAPATPMIVSESPAPGLSPTEQPDPSAIPNHHLLYAVQWFIFGVLALLIYGIALAQRQRVAKEGRAP